MRMMIKKLLKKHKYPPEGMDDAVQTVMTQCELWTDNNDMRQEDNIVKLSDKSVLYDDAVLNAPMMVADSPTKFGQEEMHRKK
jgi:type I restriction enzyme R subunit